VKYLVHAPTNGTAPPLGAALTPSMTRTYAGWSSRGQIFGQPGTMGIPVSDPAAIREEVNSMASMGQFSSQWAPDIIFPPLYYEAGNPHEHAPVSRISDDQLPVPAGRPQNVLVYAPYRARKGGQRQVVQPQVVQTFPAWGRRKAS
jgi:hypothetical protein